MTANGHWCFFEGELTDTTEAPLTDAVSVALLTYVRKVGLGLGLGLGLEPDFLREAVRVLGEALMEVEVEVEVSQQTGAERYARSPTRTT